MLLAASFLPLPTAPRRPTFSSSRVVPEFDGRWLASECSLQPNKPSQDSDRGYIKTRRKCPLLQATFFPSPPHCRPIFRWMSRKRYLRGELRLWQRRIRTTLGMYHHFFAICLSTCSEIIGFILLLLSHPAARFPGKTFRRVVTRMLKCIGSSLIAGLKGIGLIGGLFRPICVINSNHSMTDSI